MPELAKYDNIQNAGKTKQNKKTFPISEPTVLE